MIGKVYSAAVTGIYAVPVEVQADVAPGIPYFELTGNLAGAFPHFHYFTNSEICSMYRRICERFLIVASLFPSSSLRSSMTRFNV